MSEIAPLLNKLGLQSRTDLRRAAEEILRTINRKVPIGTLQKAEVARPALAISCAFRQLGENPPVHLWKETGLKKHELWKETLTRVENLAGLRSLSEVTLSTLGVRHGGFGATVNHAEQLLSRLKASGGILSDPVFVVSAYWIASKRQLNVKDSNDLKETLLAENSLEKKRFNEVCGRMADGELGGAARAKPQFPPPAPLPSRGSRRAVLQGTALPETGGDRQSRSSREDALFRSKLAQINSSSSAGAASSRSSATPNPSNAATNSARTPKHARFEFIAVDASALHPEYLAWKTEALAESGCEPLPLSDYSAFAARPQAKRHLEDSGAR